MGCFSSLLQYFLSSIDVNKYMLLFPISLSNGNQTTKQFVSIVAMQSVQAVLYIVLQVLCTIHKGCCSGRILISYQNTSMKTSKQIFSKVYHHHVGFNARLYAAILCIQSMVYCICRYTVQLEAQPQDRFEFKPSSPPFLPLLPNSGWCIVCKFRPIKRQHCFQV